MSVHGGSPFGSGGVYNLEPRVDAVSSGEFCQSTDPCCFDGESF
jgi:hypothetical protein